MNIIKKDDVSSPSPVLQGGKLRATTSPFKQRLAAAQSQVADGSKMPNRIALMLDCSSSMAWADDGTKGKTKIDLLKDAIVNFAHRTNFADTAIAIETFPRLMSLDLTTSQSQVLNLAACLNASGNTPLRKCVEWVIEGLAVTRCVIVSDGEATDWHTTDWDECPNPSGFVDVLLQKYKEQNIPIDCVHIGSSTSGEERLKDIASKTGGIFLKFTDVSAFSTAFGYLTPGYRAMLTDGSVSAAKLGAKEIR